MKIKIKVIGNHNLPLPSYGTPHSAGLDLYAAITNPITIQPGEIIKIPTGVAIALPEGFEGQVRTRSSLGIKGITIVSGVGTIDSDYRGEIFLPIINLSREPYVLNHGDRCAQLIIAAFVKAKWDLVENLDGTIRQDGGFGSTGI